MDWWNLMKQSVTVGAQLLWSGRYGCNNGRYGCTIVMSNIEINKAVSQWLLTFNLCVSVTWPLTCAFHIPCTHTPEIIDMHRGMCDNAHGHSFLNNRLDNTEWAFFISDLHTRIKIICRGVPGFATGFPCCVWAVHEPLSCMMVHFQVFGFQK